MSRFLQRRLSTTDTGIRIIAGALFLLLARGSGAQEVPLISGGAGFVTSTNGGNTTYIPIISPLLAAPLGSHVLVESSATILTAIFPKDAGQGYDHYFVPWPRLPPGRHQQTDT